MQVRFDSFEIRLLNAFPDLQLLLHLPALLVLRLRLVISLHALDIIIVLIPPALNLITVSSLYFTGIQCSCTVVPLYVYVENMSSYPFCISSHLLYVSSEPLPNDFRGKSLSISRTQTYYFTGGVAYRHIVVIYSYQTYRTYIYNAQNANAKFDRRGNLDERGGSNHVACHMCDVSSCVSLAYPPHICFLPSVKCY